MVCMCMASINTVIHNTLGTYDSMKIIFNKIIPPKGFLAINLFSLLFVRTELKDKLTDKIINHEKIHSAQQKELLWVFFYIIYFFEWLWRYLFSCDGFTHDAYRNLSFEREAYKNEKDFDYLKHRKLFAMWRK